ncbi:hypothetical protein AOQ84DRAFT_417053 [Glonium stellatum]|uniref:Uncharacterized protein n=1 Tax=Glonium stellatum TaxID=574774 RepID=A0A8E2JXU4_9PEZI|nr:hypothetical protein AOQ84DRAFT_417053 [Glonium stellatum]
MALIARSRHRQPDSDLPITVVIEDRDYNMNRGALSLFIPKLEQKQRSYGILDVDDIVYRSPIVRRAQVAEHNMRGACIVLLETISKNVAKEAVKIQLVRKLDKELCQDQSYSHHRPGQLCLKLFLCLSELSQRYKSSPLGSTLSHFFISHGSAIAAHSDPNTLLKWFSAIMTAQIDRADFDACMQQFSHAQPHVIQELLNPRRGNSRPSRLLREFIRRLLYIQEIFSDEYMGFRQRGMRRNRYPTYQSRYMDRYEYENPGRRTRRRIGYRVPSVRLLGNSHLLESDEYDYGEVAIEEYIDHRLDEVRDETDMALYNVHDRLVELEDTVGVESDRGALYEDINSEF